MALQATDDIRNGMAEVIETLVGTSPLLRIYSGTKPATVASSLSGNTVLCEMALPANWSADAVAGSKSMLGVWQDLTADAGGNASFYRILTSGGVAKLQGTVSRSAAAGGTGDLKLAQATEAIVQGQQVSISAYDLGVGGA